MRFSSVWMATVIAAFGGGTAFAQFGSGPQGLAPPSRIQQYQSQPVASTPRGYWDYQQETAYPSVAMNLGQLEPPANPTDDQPRDMIIGSGADTIPAPGSGVSGDSQPFYDGQALGGVYSSVYGDSCATGNCAVPGAYGSSWFGGVYGLVFFRDDNYAVPLVSDDALPSRTVITTNDANFNTAGGVEARLGRYLNDCWAVEGVYWGLFPQDNERAATFAQYPSGLTFMHDLSGLNYDPGTGAVPLSTYFTTAQQFVYKRSFDYHNAEVNFLRNVRTASCNSSFVWLAGARYLRLDEFFCLAADLNNTVLGDSPADELYYTNSVDNNLVGFQLGGIYDRCLTGRLAVRLGSKFGVFGNRINQTQTIFSGSAVGATINTGPYAGYTYATTTRKDDVAFASELFAGLTYQVMQNWKLSGGYRGLILTDVAIPAGQIPYNFTDYQEASNINSNDTLILHGAYAGLEYNW